MATESNTTRASSSDINDSNTRKNNVDGNFEYEAVKFMFLNHFKEFYSDPTASKHEGFIAPFTRVAVKKYIDEICQAHIVLKRGGVLSAFQGRAMVRYAVIEEHGKKILILRRKSSNEPIRRVMGAQDCYDILVQAHEATGHGGRDRMLAIIRQNYVIPLPCVQYFLKLCNVCAKSKSRFALNPSIHTSNRFNHTVQAEILRMYQPDDRFKYVLHYQDKYTDYILLRPMVTNEESELSMELLKIFADFGTPTVIKTSGDNINLMNKVLVVLMKMWPTNQVSVEIEKDYIGQEVILKLSEWMDTTSSENWAIGCHFVQRSINNDIKSNNISPYYSVFCAGQLDKQASLQEASTTEDTLEDGSEESGSDSNSTPLLLNQQSIFTEPRDVEHYLIEHISGGDISNENIGHGLESPIPELKKEEPDNVSNDSTTTDNNTDTIPGQQTNQCHECNESIIKAYICNRCTRPVHLFCSVRKVRIDKCEASMDITCNTCQKIEKKLNKKSSSTDSRSEPRKSTTSRERIMKKITKPDYTTKGGRRQAVNLLDKN